jgi:acyl carrier protein
MDETRSRLTTCFKAVFPNLRDENIPGAAMSTVEGWDSLASVTLVTVIEEEFGVEVRPEELASFVSFRHVMDYLQVNGRAK